MIKFLYKIKKSPLYILALTPTLLFAQEKYVIKGNIVRVNSPAKMFLVYNSGNQLVIDSAGIKNGHFEFTGQVNDITLAKLIVDKDGNGLREITERPDTTMLYLSEGTVMVSSTGSLTKAEVTGTKVNEDYMRYVAAAKPVFDEANSITAAYYSASPDQKNSPEFIERIQNKQLANQQEAKRINDEFISANRDAYISLIILIDMLNTDSYPDAKELQAQFATLSDHLRKSEAGQACIKRIELLETVAIGSTAPDFAQPDTNEATVKLSSFRGKYLLVDFWASWCGPCRQENQNLVKAFEHFKGKNFTILGISLDQPGKKNAWLKAIHDDQLKWSQVSDLKSWNNSAALLYGVTAIPQNLLIDPNGQIIAKNIFGNDLKNKLIEIFSN